jgi:hypothetical protein
MPKKFDQKAETFCAQAFGSSNLPPSVLFSRPSYRSGENIYHFYEIKGKVVGSPITASPLAFLFLAIARGETYFSRLIGSF